MYKTITSILVGLIFKGGTLMASISADPTSGDHLREVLDSALLKANTEREGAEFACVKGSKIAARDPIFLEMNVEGSKTPIGVTHFIHLVEVSDNKTFDKIARSVDELAVSIVRAAEVYLSAEAEGAVINDHGTPFFSGDTTVIEIKNHILWIDGKPANVDDEPFQAKWLLGEEGVTFSKIENGDYEASSPMDHRGVGKRVLFDKDTLSLYRE